MPQTLEDRKANLDRGRATSAANRARKKEQAEAAEAALSRPVADAMQAMTMTPPPAVVERVTETVAADWKPDVSPREQGDLARLLAQKIEQAYHEMGLTPPASVASMEGHLTYASGEPVMVPDWQATGGGVNGAMREVDPDEDALRLARLERKTLEHLAAPNSKRAHYLAAMRQSPPLRYYNPEEREFIVNGVGLWVKEGWIEAKKRPDDIGVGCVLIANEVMAHGQARRVETTENRRMKQIVMRGEDEDLDRPRPRRSGDGAVW